MREISIGQEHDNQALQRLSDTLPMSGNISLRIDRKPDFFALLKMRGESITFVSSIEKQIEGCISISEKEYMEMGESIKALIVSDLKFRNINNGRPLLRMLNYVKKQIEEKNISHLFATVAEGNNTVTSLMSGRLDIPEFRRVGEFDILQILSKKNNHNNPRILKASAKTSEQILNFYKSFLGKFDIANAPLPINKTCEDEYYLLRNNEIVAAIRLMNSNDLKQNVIIKAPLTIRLLLKLLNLLKSPLRLSSIPSIGEPIKLIYIRYFAYKEDNKDDFLDLIDYARDYVHQKKYTFLTIALCRQLDILNKVKKRFFHFTFKSFLLRSNLGSTKQEVNENLLCFEDYAVV